MHLKQAELDKARMLREQITYQKPKDKAKWRSEAINIYKKLYLDFKTSKEFTPQEKSEIRGSLSELYESIYMLKQAQELLEENLAELGISSCSTTTIYNLSRIYVKRGNFEEAISLYERMLAYFSQEDKNRGDFFIEGCLLSAKRNLEEVKLKQRSDYKYFPKPQDMEGLDNLKKEGLITDAQYEKHKVRIQRTREDESNKLESIPERKVEKFALISTGNLPEIKPAHIDEVPNPGDYFSETSYADLTPEQRWIYHRWLNNELRDVPKGYLYVRLYELLKLVFSSVQNISCIIEEAQYLLENCGVNIYFVDFLFLLKNGDIKNKGYFLPHATGKEESLKPNNFLKNLSSSYKPRCPINLNFIISQRGYAYSYDGAGNIHRIIDVTPEMEQYCRNLLDKGQFDKKIRAEIAQFLVDILSYRKDFAEAKKIARDQVSHPYVPIGEIIKVKYANGESLSGDEIILAAGCYNYTWKEGKLVTEKREIRIGEIGDVVTVEEVDNTYQRNTITYGLFEEIKEECEKRLREWEKEKGTNILKWIMRIYKNPPRYEHCPNFRRDGSDIISTKEFSETINSIARDAENKIRKEKGYPEIKDGFLMETILLSITKNIFAETKVLFHASPDWLGRQHLDVYVPEKKLAIEYHGEQHYHPIEFFGGEESLKMGKERDERKEKLCRRNEINLVVFRYDEEISEQLVKDRLREYM